MTLQEQPIRHNVVQGAKNYPSMGYAVVAAMMGLRSEMAQANVVLNSKDQTQTNRVIWATNETVIGVGF